MTPQTIVIGTGLAGLTTTSTLLTHHIPVLLLDRASKPGGNSIKASSGINAAPTRYQLEPDTISAFQHDTILSAGVPYTSASGVERTRREKLIDTLTTKSADALYWLTDDIGVDLSRVARLGGHSVSRTHRGAGKGTPGYEIIRGLLGRVSEDKNCRMEVGRRVTRILREGGEGRVVGVEYTVTDGEEGGNQTKTETAYGPVVVASGGFAGDARGLLAQYRPDLEGIPSTNEQREGTQPLLQEVGAAVVDMEQVQVHPTGFVGGKEEEAEAMVKILAAEALRGEGGILGTLREYADVVAGKKQDEFGRQSFGNWTLREVKPESVVYVGKVTPVVHFTMGGVVINERSQVLDGQGQPIPGLYAAGEITGGLHGQNRLGGSSLLECAVFGRIAGEEAAAYY
ncbi:hypothetical protein ASPNIDRAFT_207611, partial [Aspergillus niger ATCC 1015]